MGIFVSDEGLGEEVELLLGVGRDADGTLTGFRLKAVSPEGEVIIEMPVEAGLKMANSILSKVALEGRRD